MSSESSRKNLNRYAQIIEQIFLSAYTPGAREIPFERAEIERAAHDLGIKLPKNLGDVIYSFRYRVALPESIRAKAPTGSQWIIEPAGRGRYRFVASTELVEIVPTTSLSETKIDDATPGIITRYALNDEQALLAKLRYNRLIDIFTGVASYSLQNHLRTFVSGLGQVETDEIYVGVDRRGAHYVFPVQAKGGNDILSAVQIKQDLALCGQKFPDAVCRPIAAQFMAENLIALFELERSNSGITIAVEKHYRLVPPDALSADDIAAYRVRQL